MCRRASEVTNISTNLNLVLMPETYAVPAENIEAELAKPHSQDRITKGNLPHIWGQSLYILSNIIYEGLLLPGEIDPLGRRLVGLRFLLIFVVTFTILLILLLLLLLYRHFY